MKRVVENSKQTVWVFTMLTVMVVLSVYYLVSDPLINEAVLEKESSEQDILAELSTDELTVDSITANPELFDDASADVMDIFVGLKMERDSNRAKQFDQLYDMMNSNLSEEAIASVQGKIEHLLTVEESEFVLEKLLSADGYKDAVVLSNDNSVDVVLQTEEITKTEAVNIIKMVSERLGIPAVNVHIKLIN